MMIVVEERRKTQDARRKGEPRAAWRKAVGQLESPVTGLIPFVQHRQEL